MKNSAAPAGKEKILIVGLGSMGKRRARLLSGLGLPREILGVDTRRDRRQRARQMGLKVFPDLGEALKERPYAAFVCTNPTSHRGITRALLDGGCNVFNELNLVSDGYSRLMKKAGEKGLVLFLSSTMLYRGEINYIKGRVESFAKPVSYIYHVGQYLPDWHPWESYENFFVGDRRSNGCRELFGIELPWIIDTFGPVEDINRVSRKVSDLKISFPDTYMMTLRHKNGTLGTFAVDLVSPMAVRNLEVIGEGLHLFWEGNPKALYDFDRKTKEKRPVDTYTEFEHWPGYSDNIVENAYVDEMKNFFGVIAGTEQPRYSYEKDLYTISVMDKIEGIER